MSEREDVEAAEVVCPCGHGIQSHTWAGCVAYVRPRIGGAGACCTRNPTEVILASSWLASHDARIRVEALAPVRALVEEWLDDRGRGLDAVWWHRNLAAQLRAVLPPERLAGEAGAG